MIKYIIGDTMNGTVFINSGLDYAIKEFLAYEYNYNSIKYQSFYVIVVRILILIYGEVDIINPFKTMNEKGMGGFDVNLGKFGYPLSEINHFKEDFFNYFQLDMQSSALIVKPKNRFMVEVQKDLIDMFFCKVHSIKVDDSEIAQFYNMIYTMDNKNTYMKSYNLLVAPDVDEVKRYFDSRLFQLQNALTLNPIILNRLDFAIYNHFGITNEIVMAWNQNQVDSVNEQIFDYAQTSFDDPELLDKMNRLLGSRRKPKIQIVY